MTLLSTSNLLLIAGQETTINLTCSGLSDLLRQPDQLARMGGFRPRER